MPKKIKNGKDDLEKRLCYLDKLDFSVLPFDDEDKNKKRYKSLVFRIGQTISLINKIEIYTKHELINHHPDLNDLINRKSLKNLQVVNEKISELKKSINQYYNS